MTQHPSSTQVCFIIDQQLFSRVVPFAMHWLLLVKGRILASGAGLRCLGLDIPLFVTLKIEHVSGIQVYVLITLVGPET